MVEKAETAHICFTLGGEGLKAQKKKEKEKMFMDEKFTWSPTWQVVDKGAWFVGICVTPTSER